MENYDEIRIQNRTTMKQSWEQNPDPPAPQTMSYQQDGISYRNNFCSSFSSEKSSF